MKPTKRIQWKTSNHKHQIKLDFSLVCDKLDETTDNPSSMPTNEKNSEKSLSYDEFKALDSMEGLKDEEIQILYQKALKRREK